MVSYIPKLLIVVSSLTVLLGATANEEHDRRVRAADYVIEKNTINIRVLSDGTYTQEDTIFLKVQNETARTLLSNKEVIFSPSRESVQVAEAYTLNGRVKIPVNSDKIVTRSISPGKFGVHLFKKYIIPFNKVKVGSVVVYKTITKMSKPLIKGSAFFDYQYGVTIPERNSIVTIISDKKINFSMFGNKKQLEIKKHRRGNKYVLTIRTIGTIISNDNIKNKKLYTTGDFPIVNVSIGSSWPKIVQSLSKKYNNTINQNLPKEFQEIINAAKGIKGDIEKINFISSELSKMIAYSGNWVNLDRMFFPRGHKVVVNSGKGDCKDYATSLAGILRKMKFNAEVAIVISSNPSNRTYKDIGLEKLAASTHYFNHAIVRVILKSGRALWVDATPNASFAAGVWPNLDQSPVLVLNDSTTSLTRVRNSSLEVPIIEIDTTVSKMSDDTSEWKGNVKFQGVIVPELKQMKKLVGDTAFEKIIPLYLIGSNASKKSKFKLDGRSFIKNRDELRFKYNVLGKSPYYDNYKGKSYLRLASEIAFNRFLDASKQTGVYIQSPVKKVITTTFNGIKVVDPIEGDCFVFSPWLDYDRTVELKQSKSIVHEKIHYKIAYVTKSEASTKRYGNFRHGLNRCMAGRLIHAYEEGSAQPKVEKGKELSPIEKLPIAKNSIKLIRKLDRSKNEKNLSYFNKKTKRISEMVLKEDSTNKEAKFLRARAILELGYLKGNSYIQSNMDFALNELDEIIRANPKYPRARVLRSSIYSATKKFDDALKDISVAYYSNPENLSYIGQMAIVYASKKDVKLANSWLEALKSRSKTNTELEDFWQTKAIVAVRLKDYPEELKARIKIVKTKPKSPWAWHNLSISYSENKNLDKAIETSRKALSLMSFGAANSALAGFLATKAHRLFKSKSIQKASIDRDIEKILLESNKYDSSKYLPYSLLIFIYTQRTTIERESDWLDKADVFLAEGLDKFPKSKELISYKKSIHETKGGLLKMFTQRGIKPSGRWPAYFKK